ncbi:MAG: FeoB-associated Cys-rich membrane protein [Cyclobacteriaceae bacterium]|jgi:hypothetical protein|nr:FeoB-associated Cys-rich membrane protein [Cytophagales bacterium]HNP77850.1 FeoB-associated Cys-rich membrane protein [Cyclobacteriaceae bacterium]HQQ83038.1 FeoB-associated Cys-rich membrane protein [Cyclobacteriaceae bacterium]
MIQEIIIGLVFLVAISYIGRVIYRSFQAKHTCASGCGKCGEIDEKLTSAGR